MERKAAMIGALSILLAGCIVPSQPPMPPSNWQVIDAKLPSYIGRNIRELAERLGYPDGQRDFMGEIIFTWRTDASTPIPNGFDPPTYARTRCTIEVSTDSAGIISTYHLDGQTGACWKYAAALR